MAETWLGATKQNGIPCTFLIGRNGRIAWIGHPKFIDETIIEQLVSGHKEGKLSKMKE